MKKILLAMTVIFVQNLYAQQADVKKAIETFFEGMHKSDTTLIRSVCAESIIFQSILEKPAGANLSTEEAADFYKSIATIPAGIKIEERLLDYKIQVDGSMAHAWTPYEFYINGKLSHSGVNSFQLFKDNGAWKIIYVVDTRNVAKK